MIAARWLQDGCYMIASILLVGGQHLTCNNSLSIPHMAANQWLQDDCNHSLGC
jgi:hypothetical protein